MFNVQFNAGRSREAIREAIRQLDDAEPMYQDIAEYLVEQRRQRFVKGVGPDGKAWAPKSQATLDRYKRLGYGSLTRPLIGPSKRLSREILRFVSKDGVVIGSSLIYANVQNQGAAKGAFGKDSKGHPIPWGRIPARPWLDLSSDEDDEIVTIADEHLGRLFDENA